MGVILHTGAIIEAERREFEIGKFTENREDENFGLKDRRSKNRSHFFALGLNESIQADVSMIILSILSHFLQIF